MNKKLLVLSITGVLLLSGCGSSENSETGQSSNTTDITVERGPVLNATIRDAEGQIGVSKGNGVYSFNNPTYPIESYGGYIDINRDNIVNEGDVEMNYLHLRTHTGNVMTIATTIAENNETLKALLGDGFIEDELLNERPSTNKNNAALSDEVYKYCIENNITNPALLNIADMLALRDKIQTRREHYNTSELLAEELEYKLINDELNITTLSEDNIDEVAVSIKRNIIDFIAKSDLSLEQKATLAYMWDEERLARDIYLALNELTPSQTLHNIAINAETKHVEAVESLILKYDLNILNRDDYSGGYSAQVLATYEDGEYINLELNTMYDVLYTKGSQSLEDALEVGCMVEVTDINDLNKDIEIAGDAEDIVITFENLRSGSYSHYWAFDTALKNMGVSEGCCSIGDEYCKTVVEYPQTIKNK